MSNGARTTKILPNANNYGKEIHAYRNDDGTYFLKINGVNGFPDEMTIEIPKAQIRIEEILTFTDKDGRDDCYYTFTMPQK